MVISLFIAFLSLLLFFVFRGILSRDEFSKEKEEFCSDVSSMYEISLCGLTLSFIAFIVSIILTAVLFLYSIPKIAAIIILIVLIVLTIVFSGKIISSVKKFSLKK